MKKINYNISGDLDELRIGNNTNIVILLVKRFKIFNLDFVFFELENKKTNDNFTDTIVNLMKLVIKFYCSINKETIFTINHEIDIEFGRISQDNHLSFIFNEVIKQMHLKQCMTYADFAVDKENYFSMEFYTMGDSGIIQYSIFKKFEFINSKGPYIDSLDYKDFFNIEVVDGIPNLDNYLLDFKIIDRSSLCKKNNKFKQFLGTQFPINQFNKNSKTFIVSFEGIIISIVQFYEINDGNFKNGKKLIPISDFIISDFMFKEYKPLFIKFIIKRFMIYLQENEYCVGKCLLSDKLGDILRHELNSVYGLYLDL